MGTPLNKFILTDTQLRFHLHIRNIVTSANLFKSTICHSPQFVNNILKIDICPISPVWNTRFLADLRLPKSTQC